MQISHFTSSDGYNWAYRHWRVESPRTRLVVLHGIRSHGGWYTRSAEQLAAKGHEVNLLDRRGAGLNQEARGDTPSLRRLLDDVVEFLRMLPRDRPLLLAGISWGGKLAVVVPFRQPGLIDGLCLIAPGLKQRVSPPFAVRCQLFVNALLRPTRQFPIPLIDPELFTPWPDWQAFIRNDSAGLTEATARFFFHSFGLEVYTRKARKAVTMPTLLLLAENDRIVDNAKVLQLVRQFPTRELQVHSYPEAGHTLEFEGLEHPWFRDLSQWLDQRAGKV